MLVPNRLSAQRKAGIVPLTNRHKVSDSLPDFRQFVGALMWNCRQYRAKIWEIYDIKKKPGIKPGFSVPESAEADIG
ncbi:hypothetical protein BL250_11300 [Erwinia sp. OLTSP20]|nr:hypothetical protein BV501_06060 [Erwinia sp. OAMSP11]PIJ73671.1 hypothetical protein BK416_06040 [Erwinia sp. OLSSP12]PIJ83028.1 hypothetical protein BLD47_05535 [Erwinia sp. OLCASP19]PIJ85627.1 hypothetical protein BLD46_05565 [Erwinia sp. OLMTSP26]PIJ87724.1 hypothetical protein BLD49_05550 [Erwinia sp. OLMDSP33]PIJ92152.1 hypothetical protein BL250_11300 [Erwinia sp. OLTSP20]PIJ94720.1 hypothetical protein BL249_01610 [Erwinia sp. OLFS4]